MFNRVIVQATKMNHICNFKFSSSRIIKGNETNGINLNNIYLLCKICDHFNTMNIKTEVRYFSFLFLY